MGRKSDGSIKRSKKSDKSKKTFDKYGKYSDKHLRLQRRLIEKTAAKKHLNNKKK